LVRVFAVLDKLTTRIEDDLDDILEYSFLNGVKLEWLPGGRKSQGSREDAPCGMQFIHASRPTSHDDPLPTITLSAKKSHMEGLAAKQSWMNMNG